MAAGRRRRPLRETRKAPPETEFEPDPVVEAYKRHVDRTLLRQNLRRSATERVANLIALQKLAAEARRRPERPCSSFLCDPSIEPFRRGVV